MKMDKTVVKKRFQRSLASYPGQAQVQRKVAEKLVNKTLELGGSVFENAVEIGTGTGTLTRCFLEKAIVKHLILNDLVPEVKPLLEVILQNHPQISVQYCWGDGEKIHIPTATDLLISGSTIQWFESPFAFLKKVHTSLKKGALIAFSTFGNENFKEIKTLTGSGLTYYELSSWSHELQEIFEIAYTEEFWETLYFACPKEVLKHLQKTGVNGLQRQKWTPGKFQQFQEEYIRQFSQHNGSVKLTYHPQIIILRKK
ncbi:methyltransferase domain-containing protein [Rapidithrix thailandica]|uniref:Malonyl-[acyl-carrier protein] O-methyltransferase n=1 Tax=Rapidithrix thailandica TaxID=413964 RepID=A0AAW9SJZ7_9BACT